MHIVDIKNWTELTYQDPLLFLDENISSSVNTEEGLVSLYLPNQTIQFNLNGIESPTNLYPEIGYGGIVKYYVEDDRICCDMHLHISPACNLGYIKLQYELTEEGYEIADMKFKVYEDNRIEYTEIVTATEQSSDDEKDESQNNGAVAIHQDMTTGEIQKLYEY